VTESILASLTSAVKFTLSPDLMIEAFVEILPTSGLTSSIVRSRFCFLALPASSIDSAVKVHVESATPSEQLRLAGELTNCHGEPLESFEPSILTFSRCSSLVETLNWRGLSDLVTPKDAFETNSEIEGLLSSIV